MNETKRPSLVRLVLWPQVEELRLLEVAFDAFEVVPDRPGADEERVDGGDDVGVALPAPDQQFDLPREVREVLSVPGPVCFQQ